jgi:hypothetical protein
MQASVELINQRIKNAPQEVLDQLLGYLDALIDEYPDEIPKWQKDEVLKRRKTKNDDYLALEAIDKVIKLQK